MPQDGPAGTGASAAPGLVQLLTGFWVTQALYVAARLGVADVVREGPRTAAEIAAAVPADEAALRRLLRALTTVGVLVEDGRGRYSAAPAGELLGSDHPQSLRAFAISLGLPCAWQSWGRLEDAVVTGRPAFDLVHGRSFFAHLARAPQDAAVFQAAMTSVSRADLADVLAAYDFTGFGTIVDVGGGQGALLRGILDRCPAAAGVLFDLPAVIADAPQQGGAAGRWRAVGGDMFASVPAGGDAYLLKSILHDWGDADATRILRNCRQAIAGHGRLLVIEYVVGPPNQPDLATWMDLNMLVLLTGHERTEAEYRDLYAAAGFRRTRIIPAGGRAIIEGAPA